MKKFVCLIVFFFGGSLQERTERISYQQCNKTGKMIFRKWFDQISYSGTETAENCSWIFNLPDDVERDFLLFLYIFFYDQGVSTNSFSLPDAIELVSRILYNSNIVCRTYYKSKSVINESRLLNIIERQCPGKPYAANSWPPRITTNNTKIMNRRGIRFGLLYRWSVYPTQNTLESATSECIPYSNDKDQAQLQSTIGVVIVLAGLLCMVIIALFVLFIKFRRLKKMHVDCGSKIKVISDVQSQYEEVGNVKSHNISDESSERQMVDNIIYQSH